MSTVSGAVAPPQVAATPSLKRSVTWKSAFVVGLGGCLLICTSLGAIAGDLGPASIFVWSVTCLIGIAQCFMIAEMASIFPNKSGGTSTYSHEAFKKYPFVGALANWGYWVGWVPVIPVNLIIAAGYLRSFIPSLTDGQVLWLAIGMALVLYASNYIGLKPGIWSSAVMAVCSIFPLSVIVMSPVFLPHLFHSSNILPFVPLGGSWHSSASLMKVFKWMFVAMWSSYAMESASTTIAELKNPRQEAPKAMAAAAIGGFIAYCIVPFVMLAIVGVSVLSQDASVAFLPAAQAIFGHVGGILVSLMLITALLLGVQSSIIGSSRCMYEMTHDGQMIKQFGLINKFGVPVGSMFVDMIVTMLMLVLFKANVVNLIAASNVGYVIVFIILVPAYLVIRSQYKDSDHPVKLPSIIVPVAIAITIFNVLLLFVAGPQWDSSPVATVQMFGHPVDLTVMGLGWSLMGLVIPFYLFRRYVQDAKPALTYASGTEQTPLPELQEGDDDLGGRREVIHSEV